MIDNDLATPSERNAIIEYCGKHKSDQPVVHQIDYYTPVSARSQSVDTPFDRGSTALFLDQLAIFKQASNNGWMRIGLFDKDKKNLCIRQNNEIFFDETGNGRKVYLDFAQKSNAVTLFCGKSPATQVEQAAITAYFSYHPDLVETNQLFYKQLLILNGKISWLYKIEIEKTPCSHAHHYRSIIDETTMAPRDSSLFNEDVEIKNPAGFEQLDFNFNGGDNQ